MKKTILRALPMLAFAFVPLSAAAAQDSGAVTAVTQGGEQAPVVTRHRGVFGGTVVHYTATVEALRVTAATNGGKADVVSFAYTRDGVAPEKRPVLFLFNGGPITPSMYLHIGGLGPMRVAFPDDVTAAPSTFKLVANKYSPLDAVDLVFVDPASTGFSRVADGTKESAFFSVVDDASQFVAFIKAWTVKHGRTQSPVYILGESYGTNRAAEIAGQMSEGPSPLAGVFLYGQAVNVVEYAQRPANVTSYVASLPTIAAIAWYHQRVDRKGRSIEQFIAEASDYAKGDYLTALYQGDALPEAKRKIVAGRLEEFSGISADWYLANALKITKERYRVELFRKEGKVLGLNDARYLAGPDDKRGGVDGSSVLPEAIARFFPFYARDNLRVAWTEDYRPAAKVDGLGAWTWGASQTPFSDYPYYRGINRLLESNPQARVVVANGYFDTQTTMGAAELLVNQSGWDRSRVTLRYYDGGHMGYSVAAVARAMGDDIRAFVR